MIPKRERATMRKRPLWPRLKRKARVAMSSLAQRTANVKIQKRVSSHGKRPHMGHPAAVSSQGPRRTLAVLFSPVSHTRSHIHIHVLFITARVPTWQASSLGHGCPAAVSSQGPIAMSPQGPIAVSSHACEDTGARPPCPHPHSLCALTPTVCVSSPHRPCVTVHIVLISSTGG
jgi:hypothetical protein